MTDVFDQIKADLQDNTPIFENLSNTLKPLMQSSEIIGGLKALLSLQEKIQNHVKQSAKFTGADLMRYVDQVREETVRNRRG